ncbi:MAG TPA: amidohydrolase family protein [Burkholderiales bacterium]|nr:amidohydrolase family protein [Burkholderiales bacterium]
MISRRTFLATVASIGGTALTSCITPEPPKAGRRYSRVIDAHAHWYPREFVTLLEKEGEANGAKMGRTSAGDPVVLTVPGGTQASVMRRNMIDFDLILKEMDERQVDMYALSMTNPMVYWAPPAFALKLSQAANDAGSAAHLKYPHRFVGTIMLPLQEPRLAAQELERAAKLPGMRAINMGEHINGRNIHDKALWPIYERCEALGLPLFLHNLYPTGGERMKEFFMINTLGNPYESGYAAASLIFGGVLDAFPKLEVYLPHSGGTFPWLIGRFDFAVSVNPQLKHMKRPASDYLRRFYYDTLTHHAPILRNLIDLVGVDRIVMGTDFPQLMALHKPVDFVERIPGLTQRERELILVDNPARLLRV